MTSVSLSSFLWSIAELLRGDYKQSDYGKVILPLTLLARLDAVLLPTKDAVLQADKAASAVNMVRDYELKKASGFGFYNTAPWTLRTLLDDPDSLAKNLERYVASFSEEVRDIFQRYHFDQQIDTLTKSRLLYKVLQQFTLVDLSPAAVSNADMGTIFEELIRKFSELSNETAGEHYTPREVIELMVHLLFAADQAALQVPGVIRTIYDPAAGTGGMLAVAEEYIHAQNPEADLSLFGQELNDESYAICKADLLIKGYDVGRIVQGNTLSNDGHTGKKFDYMLSNPPFGVEWKKIRQAVELEHKNLGLRGRFGPGLPRISDGSLLFLLHLLSKMRSVQDGGSRVAIVLNGSPLFTGSAGSGESEIRKWIIEQDYLEAIVALPTDMFYNTGIATYIWLLTNHKTPERRGKIQLINATEYYQKMRKSLGSKRKELGTNDIQRITSLYTDFATTDQSKIFANQDFGYTTITIERPKLNKKGQIELDKKGDPKPDTSLRDTENVPLDQTIQAYFEQEVLPHVPDAWIDESRSKVGYEISFNRYFYEYTPPRPLAAIDHELDTLSYEIRELLHQLMQSNEVRS